MNVVMSWLAAAAAGLVVLPLLLIFAFLLWQGASAANIDFFTHLPKPVGEVGGGMANAIVGTLILLTLAAMLGLPIGILGGLYLAESRDRRLPWVARFLADVLNGVPSIVVGIFAYTIIVLPMRRFRRSPAGSPGGDHAPDRGAHQRGARAAGAGLLREAGLALASRSGRCCCASSCGPRARASSPASWWRSRVAETAPLLFTASATLGIRGSIADRGAAASDSSYAIAPYDDFTARPGQEHSCSSAGIRSELCGPRRYERPFRGKITHGRRDRRPRPQRVVRPRTSCTGSA
jgi:phosphate transport system permease protein